MSQKTLLLTLRTFSATGGIEKVCRILGKALYERSVETNGSFETCSMYDNDADAEGNQYFPTEYFRGYGVKKIMFIREMVRKGSKQDVVILSHINLLMIGWLIKKFSPKTNIILLAHGIEIWDKIGGTKRKMLNSCDLILSVSKFTMENIISSHNISPHKCAVLNNCLDPFLPVPSVERKKVSLLKKYGIAKDDIVLMTLTRLSSKERYKGYDKVIQAMADLKPTYPNIKYLIAGSYDKVEKEFLDKMIAELGLKENVVMSGYILEEELEAHFALADIYVMPSRKEGFGIVFIEAMYYGLPVIAGNKDGSVDALMNGLLGYLVDPQNITELTITLKKHLESRSDLRFKKQDLLLANFGYENYKRKIDDFLNVL